MTTLQSYRRFKDDNYKNWLKTAESLSILRILMENFIEKETETYHSSLLNIPTLNGMICKNNCDTKKNKKPAMCNLCEVWMKEIYDNHITKNDIRWENCRPQLWPTKKWEVAKAYMSRGHRDHGTFAEFDISAIFNLMTTCKHFKDKIPKNCVQEVIHVRNTVMHSPDFKMNNADREKHLSKVLGMAKKLEERIPDLKNLEKEIKQFNNILDTNFNQGPQCEVDGKLNEIENLKEIQKVLDREQQAMKEKMEDIFLLFQENHDKVSEVSKGRLHDLLDFLDQNKDLQENFGPQVSKLKGIQEKVDQHEQQIRGLKERVDNLEEKTSESVVSDKPLKYKNHLYELARKKHWPEPVFTEERDAEGYKAKVEVNGQTFLGRNVWNSTKAAHQEVATIALQKLEAENTEKPSSSTLMPTSVPGTFFGKVTVVLDHEVASGGFSSKEEANDSAYEELWKHFGDVMGPVQGQSFKSAILEYFNKHGFQNPKEDFVENEDSTTICKLKLCGPFTFHDTVGSNKKKHAEQQAAEVALKHLSKILKCDSISESEKNFKGILKESLETLSLSTPVYDTNAKDVSRGASPEPSNRSSVCVTQTVKRHSDQQPESFSTSSDLLLHQSHVSVSGAGLGSLDPHDSCTPTLQRKKARIDSSGTTYFGKVTVTLDREVSSEESCSNEKEASESVYQVLWHQFGINSLSEDQSYKAATLEYFNKHSFPNPAEVFVQNDNNTIVCKMKLSGPFTFYDTVGSTRKKIAEQQAAEVALKHLTKILKCDSISESEKNFKGILKESLETRSLSAPVYDTDEKDVSRGASPEPSNLCIIKATMKPPLDQQPEIISTLSQPSSCLNHVSVSVPQHYSPPALQSKKARIDSAEIEALLTIWNLKPPHVQIKPIDYEESFKCTVEINLEKFSFTNKKSYDSKKEAIRNTYLVFGLAMRILEPSTDDKLASAQVKQHFTQKSLPHPQEDVEGSSKPFCCSLKNITYNVIYEEQGPSEIEAKLHAFQKALSSLSPLFDFPSLTKANSPEDAQKQLSSILKVADQKDPVISLHGPLVKTSVQLNFTDHTIKCTCKGNKKAARNHLSSRILDLLGVKTDSDSPSLRNRLNEWFLQNNLTLPVFEDTEETVGAKATFSVQFTCCSPGWEDDWETAKKKLVEELKQRFQFLND